MIWGEDSVRWLSLLSPAGFSENIVGSSVDFHWHLNRIHRWFVRRVSKWMVECVWVVVRIHYESLQLYGVYICNFNKKRLHWRIKGVYLASSWVFRKFLPISPIALPPREILYLPLSSLLNSHWKSRNRWFGSLQNGLFHVDILNMYRSDRFHTSQETNASLATQVLAMIQSC